MKKLLFSLLWGFLLLGCSNLNDRLDELTDRVNNMENTTLPTIEEQIESIRETLPQLQQTDSEIKDYIITLQDKVGDLEQTASGLDDKIEALGQDVLSDISDVLSQLNGYKQEVQSKIDAINGQIETLQTVDGTLEQKIEALEGKVDMQREWIEATFATLEQYNGLVSDIATIQTNIETINQDLTDLETQLNEKIKTDIATAVARLDQEIQEKVTEITDAYTDAIGTAREEITSAYTTAVSSAIKDCITTMKSWVHDELANYYDIATVDAKVKLLQEAIAAGDAANDEKLKNEIKAVNESIETAREELTTAYQEAIETAIETNNGVIDSKIAQHIQSVNKRIDSEVQALTMRITNIERRLLELEGKVEDLSEEITTLLKRIQSVSYVPRFDDGKIEVRRIQGQDNGIAEMDFMISPKDVVSDLGKLWQEAVSVKAVHTQTRSSVKFIEMPVLDFAADPETGVITVTASGENLGEEFFAETLSASAALFISDGNNNVVSEYVPLLLNNDNPFDPNIIYYTASWNMTGISWGPDQLPVTSAPADVRIGDLTKHGFTSSGSSGNNNWGGSDFSDNLENIVLTAPVKYATFTVTAAGKMLSLNSLSAVVRITKIGPTAVSIQYSLDGTTFAEAGRLTYTRPSATTTFPHQSVDLSGVAALQNVTAGTTVTIRIVPVATEGTTTGNFYLHSDDESTPALELTGTVK